MPHESKQAVIRMQKICIDRFDIGRTSGNDMKIAYGQAGKDIAFDAVIEFEMLFAGVMPGHLSAQA